MHKTTTKVMNRAAFTSVSAKTIGIFLLAACTGGTSFAQVFSNKEVGKKNVELADSLKKSEYPYILPIWGAKATALGFNLPYSAGVSVQYFGQKSDILIDNLNVGFNNGPMYNLDGIVRFEKAVASASAVTIRPDIWLFPFLNIYGIIGRSQASTDIAVGIWIKDTGNIDNKIAEINTKVEFKATTFGLGMTPTVGIGGGWLALDMNVAWTDVPQLDKPAFTFVFGPRLGKQFKLKKPNQAIAFWVGGFRVKLNSGTTGSLNLSDVLEGSGDALSKIDQAQQKVSEADQKVEAWWNGLTPPQQGNPVNKAKYETANEILERTAVLLDGAENAVNGITNSTVQYSMDKRPKDMWNFITGVQYQINKHFMLRAEAGFLGTRNQVIAGVQYRFGL